MDDMPGRFPPAPDSGSPGGPPAWGPPPDQQGWQPAPRGFYPLDIGRVFELTISLFRFRWKTLVAIALLFEIVLSVIGAASILFIPSDPNWYLQFRDMTNPAVVNAFFEYFLSALVWTLVLLVVIGIIGVISQGALIDGAFKSFVGARVSIWTSVRHSLSRITTLAGILLLIVLGVILTMLVGLLVLVLVSTVSVLIFRDTGLSVFFSLIGWVAVIVALFFVLIRWSMAVQVAMVESLGAVAALRRSWHLVAGSGWRVLGYMLAFGLLVGLIGAVIAVFVSIFINPYHMVGLRIVSVDPVRLVIAQVVGGIVSSVLLPIPTIATTLLYFDLRFRKGERAPEPGQGLPTEQQGLPTEQ